MNDIIGFAYRNGTLTGGGEKSGKGHKWRQVEFGLRSPA